MNKLYNANGVLKIKDYIHLINFLSVKDVVSNQYLEAFSNYFTNSEELYDYLIGHSAIMEDSDTQFYSSFSIRNKTACQRRCHL